MLKVYSLPKCASIFKTKFIGNDAETSRVNRNARDSWILPVTTPLSVLGRGAGTLSSLYDNNNMMVLMMSDADAAAAMSTTAAAAVLGAAA